MHAPILLSLALLLTVLGCGTTQQKKAHEKPAQDIQTTNPPPRLPSKIAPVAQSSSTIGTAPADSVRRRATAKPITSFAEVEGQVYSGPSTNLYSFSAANLEIKDALALFARSQKLNIVPDPDVTGVINVEFNALPLDKAMEAFLDALGYYAEIDQGLIRVHKTKTEIFTIDYIRLVRAGIASSSANLSSGSSGGGSGGGGASGGAGAGQEGATVTINQTDTIKFWEELETELQTILSGEAKLAINRTSGQIMVSDTKENVDFVADYLASMKETLHRQVDIEARIYELVLDDEFHLGIDWRNVNGYVQEWLLSSGGGFTGIPTSRLIVDSPIGGQTPKAPTVSLSLTKGDEQIVLQALEEQGDLDVVSQPRIRTLNNQAALIKVGSDKPFFRRSSTIITGTGPSEVVSDTKIQVITIGTILSLTPQISEDGWITMDISPIITRLVDTVEGPDGATAPEVDIKQTSSLVRMRNNETVVIGGLIQNEHYKTVRKVPLLADIPLLGRLFKGVYKKDRKTELVIFITPTIVD